MEKCPSCERKFQGITDFPLIVIHEFRGLEVPETLEFEEGCPKPDVVYKRFLFVKRIVDNPEIPLEVLKVLRESKLNKMKYGELIYFIDPILKEWFSHSERYPNSAIPISVKKIVPNEACELMKSPDVLESLSKLEEMVGREVKMDEILALRGFSGGNCISYGNRKDIEFLFYEKEVLNTESRKSVLELAADIGGYDCHLGGSLIGISQNLAEITYEGRVNSH